jgi:group I intron endonuclease
MKGIYKIINNVNGKFYLGSSKNFHKRKLRHFNELRKNKHHSIHLQRAFNKYGEENFIFVEVEICENTLEREQELLDSLDLKSCYNVSSSASGGDLISNHPDRKKILERNTKVLKNAKNRGPVDGDKNPNWKGGKTFCGCGTRINSNSISCIKCADKTGINNSFYNKTHTKKTKEKIRKARIGNYNGNQEKIVIAEGIEYKSLSLAAKVYKVVPATILNRIKSKNYPNFIYK